MDATTTENVFTLRALSRVLKKNEANISLLRDDQLDGTWESAVEAGGRSSQFTSSLRVAAIGSAVSSFAYESVIWDGLVGRRVRNEAPGSKIKEVFWAAGLRIALTYRAGAIKGSLNIGVVAAEAEAAATDVQYSVTAMGLGPRSLAKVLRTVPPFGTFDLMTYARLNRAKDEMVKNLYRALSPGAFTPDPNDRDLQTELRAARDHLVPAEILIDIAGEPASLARAAAWRFGMQCIREGLTLPKALTILEQSSFKPHVAPEKLQEIYKAQLGNSTTEPNNEQIDAARKWLKIA